MQKNPLPSPWLCYTVRVSLFIDFGWAWSWKGEKRKGILCKSTAVSTPGVNTPLHHIPEGWNTCPKKDKAGSTQALPYPPCSSKEDWLLTMLSWRMNLHTGLQQEHQATVDTQPSSIIHLSNSELSPSWGKVQGCINGWEVTLVPEAGEAIYCTAKTVLHYLQAILLEQILPKPSNTNTFSLNVWIKTTREISNMSNLNVKVICYFKVFINMYIYTPCLQGKIVQLLNLNVKSLLLCYSSCFYTFKLPVIRADGVFSVKPAFL